MKEANKAAAGTHSKEELDAAVAKLKVSTVAKFKALRVGRVGRVGSLRSR